MGRCHERQSNQIFGSCTERNGAKKTTNNKLLYIILLTMSESEWVNESMCFLFSHLTVESSSLSVQQFLIPIFQSATE